MFGVTRSAGTRRIPTDDHSVAPPNVAWWPPRWPIKDVSDGGGTRRRALPGVVQLFKCATCHESNRSLRQPPERPRTAQEPFSIADKPPSFLEVFC